MDEQMTTPPDMEQKTVETYRDGVLVETHMITEPKTPPSAADLQRQIAELQERLKEAETPATPPAEEVS